MNIRYFAAVALFTLAALSAAAQQPDDKSLTFLGGDSSGFVERLFPKKPFSAWSLGVTGGVAGNEYIINTLYAENVKYSGEKGFTAALQCRWHATGWLALRADLALVQKNYSSIHAIKPSGNNVVQMRTITKSNYIDLPLMLELSMGRKVRIYANGGAYAGFWAWGHVHGESLSMDYLLYDDNEGARFDEAYTFDSRRDNRFDGGLVYGAGVAAAIGTRIALNAEWRCYYGLTDTQKNYMRFQMPRYNTTTVFQVGAAWNL